MRERTYHQYCPIAHALDLVGDRWALLVVRDLLLGPKRFTDLLRGLPGIGTNILTDRLKGLEQAGVVRQRVLPPPAASTVYELTPYGRKLDGVIGALAQWGEQTLGAPQAHQVISHESVLLGLWRLFRGAEADCEVRVAVRCTDLAGDDTFSAHFGLGQVDVHPLRAVEDEPEPAPALLSASAETLFALGAHRLTLARALADGRAQLEGDADTRAHLLDALQG